MPLPLLHGYATKFILTSLLIPGQQEALIPHSTWPMSLFLQNSPIATWMRLASTTPGDKSLRCQPTIL